MKQFDDAVMAVAKKLDEKKEMCIRDREKGAQAVR